MQLQPVRAAVLRFLRGSAVGIVATLLDMGVLAILVEGLRLAPAQANVPALIAGAAVQFLGCRHLVFRACTGSVPRQLVGFAATEAGTLALNGIVFHLLVSLTPVPYPLARMLGTFLVFVGFSYPLWGRVFRPASAGGAEP
jgi:putative flippase GtrA